MQRASHDRRGSHLKEGGGEALFDQAPEGGDHPLADTVGCETIIEPRKPAADNSARTASASERLVIGPTRTR